MKTGIILCCLGVLVADVFFCGGGKQLTTAQESKFDNDVKQSDAGLSDVEDALKPLEGAPAEAAAADLAAIDQKLSVAIESIKVVEKDFEPWQHLDAPRTERIKGLKDRRSRLDERLAGVYRLRLSAEARGRLDAATEAADRLEILDGNLLRAESGPRGEGRVRIDQVRFATSRERGPTLVREPEVFKDVRMALRDLSEEIAQANESLAAVKEFIDGPSRDQISSGTRKRLEAAAARYADLRTRCDAAMRARGVE
jgi:hypothetical protein